MTSPYTDQQKADAIAQALAGTPYSEISQSLGVPSGTIRSWVSRSTTAVATVATDKSDIRERFGRLLLDYIGVGLGSLRTQAELLGDTDFLRGQNGQIFAVAQAHRLLGDQLARYLAAIQLPTNED